jgi:hypothetical protein
MDIRMRAERSATTLAADSGTSSSMPASKGSDKGSAEFGFAASDDIALGKHDDRRHAPKIHDFLE